MQCPACGHESSAASFGDPLRCPDCGADYAKALLYKERAANGPRGSVALKPDVTSTVPDADIPKYIKASLSTGEVVVAIFKVHWLTWVRFWFFMLLAVISVGILFFLPLIVWLQIRSLEQGLTNKRVIVKRGIISRRTEEMKLTSIETVELNQGIGGRILGYGNVRVTGRGISDVVFRFVADPLWVKRQIEGVSQPVY
jgi:DNA-directed RNA polymerase subunit RPC12/RpoP